MLTQSLTIAPLHNFTPNTSGNTNNFTIFPGVGESLNGVAVSVKESVIGAVKSIENGVDDLANDVEHKIDAKFKSGKTAEIIPTDENGEPLCKIIPLKDSKAPSLDEMDEFKDMLNKMTEDQIPTNLDTATKAVDSVNESHESVQNKMLQGIAEMEMNDKTPTHSLDSLKTSTPEPEIINAMLNDTSKGGPSPKPTLKEMKSIEEMDPLDEVLKVVLTDDVEKNKL